MHFLKNYAMHSIPMEILKNDAVNHNKSAMVYFNKIITVSNQKHHVFIPMLLNDMAFTE